MFDGDLGRKLPAAATRADSFASRSAVDVAAAFEFDQIAPVADYGARLHQFDNSFHMETSVSRVLPAVASGSD